MTGDVRRYEITDLGLYVCSECPDRTAVVDADAHDRWHAEQAARADPAQAAMF